MRGNLLFGAAWWVMGLGMISFGVYHWVIGHEPLSWPMAKGTITRSGVGPCEKRYCRNVTYTYRVHGRELTGNVIRRDDTRYSTRSAALAAPNRYRVGREVQVRYDPEDPREAVLEPGVRWGLVAMWLTMGGLLVVWGLYWVVAPRLGLRRQAASLRLQHRSPRPAVGLDIGASCLKLCRVKRTESGLQLTDLVCVDLPPGVIDADRGTVQQEQLTEHLERLFQEAGVGKEDVAFSVPTWAKHAVISKITLAVGSDEEPVYRASREVHWHLPRGAADVEQVYAGYRELRRDEHKMEVLLVVNTKAVVQPYLQCVLQAGIKPVSCSPTALAARRWYEQVGGQALAEGQAIVDVGAARTVVHAAATADEKGIFCVDAGGEEITTGIRERLNLSREEAEQLIRNAGRLPESAPGGYRSFDRAEIFEQAISAGADALAKRIAEWLEAFQSQEGTAPISRLALTGGGANLPQLREALARHSGLPVERWAEVDGLEVGARVDREVLRAHDTRLSVALGLAIDEGGLHLV